MTRRMETLPVPASSGPTPYERRALEEIRRWKQPETGWLGKTVDRVNQTLRGATDLVRKVPGVEWTIENVVSGLLQLTNEIVQDSVWREAIYAEYRAAGHAVDGPADLHRLDLETLDAAMEGLDAKYRAVAATQGAAAGFAGAAGIVPDVVGLVALNLRAAGEYATYCGYDLTLPAERFYALQILNVVSQGNDTERQEALVPLTSVSHAVARQQTVQTVEQVALSGTLAGVARALGARLTRIKLAQVIPMTGALVSGGFNAYYTTRVCDAAYALYRERYLVDKYGAEVLAGSP